ncbi:MAG: hypothetical protein ACYCSR_11750 [Thiomonas sp.]
MDALEVFAVTRGFDHQIFELFARGADVLLPGLGDAGNGLGAYCGSLDLRFHRMRGLHHLFDTGADIGDEFVQLSLPSFDRLYRASRREIASCRGQPNPGGAALPGLRLIAQEAQDAAIGFWQGSDALGTRVQRPQRKGVDQVVSRVGG